jgi:predicted peptidase
MTDARSVLEYIIERHNIDRNRIYLTGISNGGTGVWNFAEAYPDLWAAVAPVSSFRCPDVAAIRHLPAWIFHGSLDEDAPVAPQRELVGKLKQSGCDCQFTEFSNKGHSIFAEIYDSQNLYDWFLTKHRIK